MADELKIQIQAKAIRWNKSKDSFIIKCIADLKGVECVEWGRTHEPHSIIELNCAIVEIKYILLQSINGVCNIVICSYRAEL